jgi:serine/threonine protein kinase
MIAFLCSNCGAELRVNEALAGTKGKCPRCKQMIDAPLDGSSAQASDAGLGERAAHPSTGPDETTTSSLPAAGTNTDFDSDVVHSERDLAFLDPPEFPGELGRVGQYRVVKVLGSGAMGIVFQAEDVPLKRPVAIKSLKADLAAREADRRRFLREAQMAAAIDHPHIVTIYQVGEHHGIPYLAMKLLRGQSLEERINDRGGWLPLPEVLRIGQEIAEGLAAAHARGLIHRDIKPANIWLEEDRDWVRIVDFGLARASSADAHLTQTGMIVGTPSYMAPEQACAEPVDHRGDLFSLGCLLYRMSTGQLPFRGKSMTAVLLAVTSATPVPPRDLNPSLPPAFSALVLSLLEKAPADRPASAMAVWHALEQVKHPAHGGLGESPAARKGRAAAPVSPPTPPKGHAETRRNRSAEETEVTAVEATAGRSAAKSRASGKDKKRRSKAVAKESDLERKVMTLAVWVGIAIFCLVVFLIVRHLFSKRTTTEGTNQRGLDIRVALGKEYDRFNAWSLEPPAESRISAATSAPGAARAARAAATPCSSSRTQSAGTTPSPSADSRPRGGGDLPSFAQSV